MKKEMGKSVRTGRRKGMGKEIRKGNMKFKKRIGIVIMAIAAMIGTESFLEKGIFLKAASAYFSIIETNVTIMVGETDFVEVELAADIAYKESDIVWKSDNSSIASVETDGIITGIAEGTTVITGTMPDGSSETCTVTVSGYMNDEDNPIYNTDDDDQSLNYNETPDFTGITVTRQMTVYVGGNEWVELSFEPQGADEETITWKSSNPKVATVDDGLVTGIKSGTVQIIAMTPNDITAACTVTVKKPQITLEKSSAKLKVGKRVQIKASCMPDTKPTFKSQDKTIASVTAKGMVKAKKKGKTVIVVKANGVSKKFNVTVVR